MGGFGSGRPGWHTKAEHCRSLDVNKLRRDGALAPGYQGGREWRRDGEVVASIGLRASTSGLHLTYRMSSLSEKPEDIAYTVPLTWSPCTKGGTRPYFLCPGSRNERHCGRRVAKLYLHGRWFLCRHCHQLAYASQAEVRHDRLLRRRNKLSDRLSPGDHFEVVPPRPKGMWHRTYEARLAEIFHLEEEANDAFVSLFSRRFPGLSIEALLRS